MNEITVIQNKIYEIRGQRVMLDFDLAQIYQVETKVLKQAVRRNIGRFPQDFMFEITNEEYNLLKISLRSQFVTSNKGGIRYMPFAFTEMGVSMLSSVLRSEIAIQANIAIMRAFVAMRNYITTTTTVTAELSEIRAKTWTMPRRSTISRKTCAKSWTTSTKPSRPYRSRYRNPSDPGGKSDIRKPSGKPVPKTYLRNGFRLLRRSIRRCCSS